MKTVIVSLAVLFMLMPASAQVRVNVNVNIGSQPAWGPAGYDYAEYYYLPDIDVYYYVPARQFIYFRAGNWVFVSSLPSRFGYYDLYRGYKVVINAHRPYLRHSFYKVKYAGYRGMYGRQSSNAGVVRFKNDKGNKHGGNGHSKGRGRGHGRH